MSEVGLAESEDESKGQAFLGRWFLTLCLATALIWFPFAHQPLRVGGLSSMVPLSTFALRSLKGFP